MAQIPVPQIIKETGVSGDYYNEVQSVAMAIGTHDRVWLAEELKERPIRKYEERYPTSVYQNTITEQNRARTQQIDYLVDRVNKEMTDADALSDQDILDFVNKFQMLIYGRSKYPDRIENLKRI